MRVSWLWLVVLCSGCPTTVSPDAGNDAPAPVDAFISDAFISDALISDAPTSDAGPGSGASCAPSSTLSYENFGRTFFRTNCTPCHSSANVGAARRGAPASRNFDTLAEIQAQAQRIDTQAAAGPSRINTFMPFSTASVFPTEMDRRQLGEWLSCGAP